MSTSRMLTVMLDSDATQNVNSSCLFRFLARNLDFLHANLSGSMTQKKRWVWWLGEVSVS